MDGVPTLDTASFSTFISIISGPFLGSHTYQDPVHKHLRSRNLRRFWLLKCIKCGIGDNTSLGKTVVATNVARRWLSLVLDIF